MGPQVPPLACGRMTLKPWPVIRRLDLLPAYMEDFCQEGFLLLVPGTSGHPAGQSSALPFPVGVDKVQGSTCKPSLRAPWGRGPPGSLFLWHERKWSLSFTAAHPGRRGTWEREYLGVSEPAEPS